MNTRKRARPFIGAPRSNTYNYSRKRSRPSTYGWPAPAIYPPSRAVPGVTRTVGAYQRSRPNSREKKYFDTAIGPNLANASAGLIAGSLNLVPAGTTDTTRVGNKITITNVNIKCFFNQDDIGAAVPGGFNMRMILYIDKQANGAVATVGDLLTSTTIQSFRNMTQLERFEILKDQTCRCVPVVTNVLHSDDTYHYFTWSKRVNVPVYFSGTTGAITEIRSNNIGILFIADRATANIGQIGQARVKYYDD